ncbi:hypothetical protein DPMN_154645 [Dreissena polymorpha]|uniref:Uncharacterized protein n=1 Tax=Dreissena polymorpha TaxID=45954 RepID=A0A9D4FNN2_DREPO|nr:hypothetical protein DPMN_154537 [Dreissena polymorpha]KAH3801001.1 hypothetical protein DPMN_154645 [Dreissena polymorpha]
MRTEPFLIDEHPFCDLFSKVIDKDVEQGNQSVCQRISNSVVCSDWDFDEVHLQQQVT